MILHMMLKTTLVMISRRNVTGSRYVNTITTIKIGRNTIITTPFGLQQRQTWTCYMCRVRIIIFNQTFLQAPNVAHGRLLKKMIALVLNADQINRLMSSKDIYNNKQLTLPCAQFQGMSVLSSFFRMFTCSL